MRFRFRPAVAALLAGVTLGAPVQGQEPAWTSAEFLGRAEQHPGMAVGNEISVEALQKAKFEGWLLLNGTAIFRLPQACQPPRRLGDTGEARKLGDTGQGRNLGDTGQGRNLGDAGEGRKLGDAGEGRKLGDAGEGRKLGDAGQGRNLGDAGEGRKLGDAGQGRNLGDTGMGRNLGDTGAGRKLGDTGAALECRMLADYRLQVRSVDISQRTRAYDMATGVVVPAVMVARQ